MRESLNRRLGFISLIMLALTGLIVYRLISLQFSTDTAYFTETALTEYNYQVTRRPPRGEIYDRNGVLLATNAIEYEIGLSPSLISDREDTAAKLSEAMGIPVERLLESIDSDAPYVQLVRPAPAAMGQRVLELDLSGVVVSSIPRRYYPHGSMAAHVLGFVALDDVGYYGIEGFYDEALQGKLEVDRQSRIPFEATGGEGWQSGSDIHLTIDSDIQYLAESTLAEALASTGAESGTIIVLQPRTGEILAMASLPTFDPNLFATQDSSLFENPAISKQYEPGSVMKAITMAIALEEGIVTPETTYYDDVSIDVGGATIYNWDRAGHGVTDMTTLLAKSLNVGAAWLSLNLGPTRYYNGLDNFGFGQRTGIDLEGEIAGMVRRPGNANWYESDLGTNSFGQGMAATPLQVIVGMSAIANDGLIMQPRLAARRVDADGTVTEFEPTVIGRAISAQTAATLKEMLMNALQQEASPALVPGYRVAGKTSTSEIPIAGGYDPERTIASFVGFGPVDDPQFVVLIKLDKPTTSRWGSETAAPVFGRFVSRLVVLMEIPPDDVRTAGIGGG
ncbi:MAG: penicillin-binding protein 2 [Aggregatilineales bacterium]|nr:penicillin-binding protein 2 [Aggregatilineales bacterium]HQE17209.1 penicillin-binding protein 2 [Aggregatilineales bacterium]